MATNQQSPGRIEPMESLEVSVKDAETKAVSTETVTEQPPVKEGNVNSSVSRDSGVSGLPVVVPEPLGSLNSVSDQNAIHSPNYAPHAQTFFYGGFEGRSGEWEEYNPYLNFDGVDIGSAGIYNENPSLMYHTGYGYSQMPYGAFSPVTTLPSGDGQNYHPQHFPFSGGYYQPPPSPGITYLPSPTAVSQADLSTSVDHNGSFLPDTSSSNNMLFGPRPTYQASYGSFSRDWLKSPDGTGSVTPSPAASPQPMGTFMSFGQNTAHLTSGVDFNQQRSMYSFGSTVGSFDRGYHGGFYHESTFGGSVPSFGVNGRGLIAVDKTKRHVKGNTSLCSCNNTLDFLTEQNRGPRANKTKNLLVDQNSSIGKNNDCSTGGFDRKLYNSPDFVTEYKDAKFFIIKSYSEDNVHKSIKYGVWASTTNGNKKLDSAYRESREKEEPCPIFLFFSVNASAQFCGVAEIIGPVDFEKSVNYWQQDKWSGQFPVKWHIVKDIPNNLFRHITLENNDNKPVTNSRDTQEVKLEQGLEMLSIFKKHEYEDSILDDFAFYEEREKAMQERKAHQHHQQLSNSIGVVSVAADEKRNVVAVSGDFVDQLSKSFADAVRMEERNSGDVSSIKSNMGTDMTAEAHRKSSAANVGKSS